MSDECKGDLQQMKELRNAAYKSGYAMAASNLRSYLRLVERGEEPINIGKLIMWTENCQQWRKDNELSGAPEL